MSTQQKTLVFSCPCRRCRGSGRKVPAEVAREPIRQYGLTPIAEPTLYESTRALTRLLLAEYGEQGADRLGDFAVKSDFAKALALDPRDVPKPQPARENYSRSAAVTANELELAPSGRYTNAQRIRAALNVAGYDPSNESHFRMVKSACEQHLRVARERPPQCFETSESLDDNF